MGACLSVHPSIPLLNPRAGRQLHPTPLLLLLTAALPGGERHLLYQLQHPSVQVKTQQLGSLVRAGTGSEGGERCRMEPSSLEAGKEGGGGWGQMCSQGHVCCSGPKRHRCPLPQPLGTQSRSPLRGCSGTQPPPTQPWPSQCPSFPVPWSNPHVPQGMSHGHLFLQPVSEMCCPQHPAQI